ncbi:hypothetical protein BOO91_02265 [Vibrio navarrensis]|uniref:Purine-binding chemotaxis protein CheW n=1 Tax=Vibrio navarrensis TaxID=29495 RepID=A0AAJ4IEJ9_9VIBR|nr:MULTISPECIES: chemotaxis protein CheW [Vibrio]KJR30647.1 hypothetical protein UF06_08440 [Vibrio sp. S234-5]MBE3653018.1 hypothetical protein [Vibrio navarrensis]MBE3655118.1 hypothetical protein [Vibrio navarrensis]MBE3659772.1 hypothetical protein [Vibrio navarrensis]MBE4604051.1 hypothetical protein [Vibrio navarrensis]
MKQLTAQGKDVRDIDGHSRQYLTFSVDHQVLAISILDVKEIIELAEMTRVPMTSQEIRGVINLRGNVVPVVDLPFRLLGTPAKMSKRSCIVFVETEHDEEHSLVGMMVDNVREILDIADQQLQSPPEFGTDIANEYIHHMARYNEDFITLLNINRVLTLEEISQHQSAVEHLPEVVHA